MVAIKTPSIKECSKVFWQWLQFNVNLLLTWQSVRVLLEMLHEYYQGVIFFQVAIVCDDFNGNFEEF